jgi:hypothetical protein
MRVPEGTPDEESGASAPRIGWAKQRRGDAHAPCPLSAGHAAPERVLVDPEPTNARFQRAGRDTEYLRGTLDAVHPAATGRQRLFDLLALTAGATLSGANNIGTEAGKLEIGRA